MYVEKPLGVSIMQERRLRDVIHEYNRIFQFGTQQRSDRNFRFACELVLNGRIGRLHTIKVGVPGGKCGENLLPQPVPDWIDYDLWLGPAPWRSFNEKAVINDYWWHTSDYTLGWISGWGIHHVDIGQWGNDAQLSGPVEIEGSAVFPKDGFRDCAVTWDVNLKYSNGVLMNFTDTTKNRKGVTFEGTEGWVFVNRGGIDARPESLLTEVIGPNEKRLPVSNHHQRNLLDCIKSRKQTVAPIDIAVRSNTVCHLADIATRLRRKVRWDPDKEIFINDEQANRMMDRAMRSPWTI
jgi:predicted dehydrogenase